MSAQDESPPVFREVQQFRQWWVWALLLFVLAATLVPAIPIAAGMVQQLILDEPWGDRPMSDGALIAFGIYSAGLGPLVGVGLLVLFRWLKLVIAVRPDGVHVRFAPLVNRHIRFDDIQSCQARTYHPLREFGGWGIRWGRHGTAYNVSGNRGVQLVLKSNQRLLLGSQRADELADAILTHLPESRGGKWRACLPNSPRLKGGKERSDSQARQGETK